MTIRRFLHGAIGLVLAVLFAVGAFLTPGFRHRHEGGQHSHTHSSAQSHHHHGHSHPHHHGHSHPHHHDHKHGHGHSHAHAQSHHDAIAEARPHIHVRLFGFQLTLPDFLGGDQAPLTAGSPAVRPRVKSKPPAVPEIQSLPIVPQLVRFVMEIRCLVPDKVALAANTPAPSSLSTREPVDLGLARSEPPVPPPKAA